MRKEWRTWSFIRNISEIDDKENVSLTLKSIADESLDMLQP